MVSSSTLQVHSRLQQLIGLFLGVLLIQVTYVHSWTPTSPSSLRRIGAQSTAEPQTSLHHQIKAASSPPRTFKSALNAFETKEKSASSPPPSSSTTTTQDKKILSVEETTESYGLEAGLFQSLQKKDGGQSAKDLLAKYGVAYLATSIPLAIVSFAICYLLVDSGVDVAALLSNVGIEVSENGERVGTFALAYTAHKAASPIRFPPTVLLTPVVAKMIGKEPDGEDE